jgi:hypothetical protein
MGVMACTAVGMMLIWHVLRGTDEEELAESLLRTLLAWQLLT